MKNSHYHAYKHSQKRQKKEEEYSYSSVYALSNRQLMKRYERTKHPLWKMLNKVKKLEVIKSFTYGIPNSQFWTSEVIVPYPEFKGDEFKDFLDYLFNETEEFRDYKVKMREDSIDHILR